jgi:putative phosphoesterase
MLIGVLADTHIPDRTNELPDEILGHFQGADMILHAGDVCEQQVLERLSALAPVVAVRGNRDERLPFLPERTVVSAGRWHIGLIHGTRSTWEQGADRLRYLGGDRRFADQRRFVRQAFAGDDVHCIVFGHTHQVCNETVDGVLLFNPGGVLVALGGWSSSVGLLEISDAGIIPRIILLQHPPRPLDRLDQTWLSWSKQTRR